VSPITKATQRQYQRPSELAPVVVEQLDAPLIRGVASGIEEFKHARVIGHGRERLTVLLGIIAVELEIVSGTRLAEVA